MVEKRMRGRPQGSGKKDDQALLCVARKMVRDASLKPTTAMKHVIGERKDWPETDETLLRRLQVKWKDLGEAYLARAQRELQTPTRLTAGDLRTAIATAMLPSAEIKKMLDAVRVSQSHEMQGVAAAIKAYQEQQAQMRALYGSSNLARVVKEMQEQSLQYRAALASASSPIQQAIKDMQKHHEHMARIAEVARTIPQLPKYTIPSEVLALSKPYYPTK